ncbi:helix-turn-helix domain-containing protein [Microseira wollei]|uniref:HTH cro/C1-type domain-containing protein n=1 Tax=Microseira wollei NIES-4236 TaxID=2530354 RepID=A0AAV3XES7_9CYAN|nr:helix-turn-helix transcriptional regulator [Microseira wollei]GET40728.1 hypothetical protein MiSe_55390 [Microseira wollei NIES-4236]
MNQESPRQETGECQGISQNKLAIAMEIAPANVSRWVNEVREPTGDVIFEIKSGLEKLDPEAAEEFVMLYLYNSNKDSE